MSIRLMSAAWELSIPSTEKMVLMCLCDFASDDGGTCWPSVATLARKCSKGERTVQGAIRSLEDLGFLTTQIRSGTSNSFKLNPRKICTPAESAPPQKTAKTPAESAPKPPLTTKPIKQRTGKHNIPANWEPVEFGQASKSRAIVDSWPTDDLTEQIERFAAHHRKLGNKYEDWQSAWSTWVLNSKTFKRGNGNGSKFQNGSGNGPDKRSGLARAIDAELAGYQTAFS
jgi:hypothetical protein